MWVWVWMPEVNMEMENKGKFNLTPQRADRTRCPLKFKLLSESHPRVDTWAVTCVINWAAACRTICSDMIVGAESY